MIPNRRGMRRTAAATVAAAVLATLPLLAHPAGAVAAWAKAGTLPQLGSGRVWSVAIDPAQPATVIAGTDAGVFVSGDAGATWKATTVKGVRAWTVAFDLRAPNAMLAGLAGRGVMRSDDDGATWTDASAGLPDRDVRVLATGLGAIAAATSNGVAVSSDGRTWRSAGLTGYSVSALTVSANVPQFTLVAGVDGGPANAPGFLFRNAGPGPQWDALQQGLPSTAVVSSLSSGPLPQTAQSRPLLVATNKGTFRSGDGGTTWTPSAGIPEQSALTVVRYSPVDPNLVYAGADAAGSTGGLMLRSTDSGQNFAPFDQGLPDQQRNVATLAVANANPPLVVAGVDPPGGGGMVFTQTDQSAPAPAPVAAEGSAPLATPAPAPAATAKPRTTPVPEPATAPRSALGRFVDHVLGWPFPLAVEILVILVAAWIVLRWRQRRLDIEGPP